MIRNKESFDAAAAENGWTAEPFLLFNGRTLTTYSAMDGIRQVQVETDTRGGIVWAATSEDGWIVERLSLEHDHDVLRRAMEWLTSK